MSDIIAKIIEKIIENMSEEFSNEIAQAVIRLEEKAKASENPWDDVGVLILKVALGIN